ncbi:hypothetical protein SpCBS45565_g01890 [Spizellomyces sp. 'palustris']|nr:hypothetical protein SpCBS45565_g01890 [Spizellomyces sp. 'palustris']
MGDANPQHKQQQQQEHIQQQQLPSILSAIECDTALGLFACYQRNTPLVLAAGLPTVHVGELVDISGAQGCGKTQLLMQLIALAVLPATWTPPSATDAIPLRGSATPVLLIDLDLRFSLSQLAAFMRAHIQLCISPTSVSQPSLTALINSSLSRLHICRPTSPLQMLATLLNAPKSFILEQDTLSSLVVIDGYSTYYWFNRFDDYDINKSSAGQPSMHRAIARALRRLKQEYACGVIVTRGERVMSRQGDFVVSRDTVWTSLVDRFVMVWKEQEKVRWKEL